MEIKKAFEKFKKEIAKEAGLKGGFSMSMKQIKLGTATYSVNNIYSFDSEIETAEKTDAKVQSYDTWTEDEKAKSHARIMETIENLRAEQAKWGSKENQLMETVKMIASSNALADLEKVTGEIELTTETKGIINYIRFNY